MYVALIVLVRFAKKRLLNQATAFNYILVVLIGAVAGLAMTGGAPYFVSPVRPNRVDWDALDFFGDLATFKGFSHLIKGNATTHHRQRQN